MEYDGATQKFRASTRKGATLEFDSLRAVQAHMHHVRANSPDQLTLKGGRPGSAAA